MSEKPKVNTSRRSATSQRTMTPARRLYYALGMPLLKLILRLLQASYRYQPMLGKEHLAPFLDGTRPCAPCYWHQFHVLCSTEIFSWIKSGFKPCFLVSGSVDGDVPERIARGRGAEVIRGSANQSGALALRDMQAMMKRGYSIVTTADGPRGPQHEFKTGAIVMARVGGVPILPVAAAADRAWYLNRWDRFMIPKPFAKVVIGIGPAIDIDRKTPLDALEPIRGSVQAAVSSVLQDCQKSLQP
ncbi:MAG: DUF374 domain-containing protein [Pseudomonadota bacterium]